MGPSSGNDFSSPAIFCVSLRSILIFRSSPAPSRVSPFFASPTRRRRTRKCTLDATETRCGGLSKSLVIRATSPCRLRAIPALHTVRCMNCRLGAHMWHLGVHLWHHCAFIRSFHKYIQKRNANVRRQPDNYSSQPHTFSAYIPSRSTCIQ
jgi:hypothetical protein